MRPPRGLTVSEQAAWAHLAASVKPLPDKKLPVPPRKAEADQPKVGGGVSKIAVPAPPAKFFKPAKPANKAPPPPAIPGALDSHWERRMKAGRIDPDLTLDLHGHTLDSAYERIMAGLDQARMMGARVVLVIAGRERPVDPADRMDRRGAIRAKLIDWLAASRHSGSIAAVRRAHIRHGGEGALYLILKRRG
ncbi:Smr/MutS family protein [Erythrobacter tepidarius]|uniref:Smr/MutS family protein n=1 Tax=Erythrobacter tepidarius TaxID=60454 RepID=UPI000A36E466|nr:Smr/MutS family protein [Erythrobacter tepidarius]